MKRKRHRLIPGSRRTAVLLGAGAISVFVLAACAPPPQITVVEPRTMSAGSATTLDILGSGFELQYNAWTNTTSTDFSAALDPTDGGANRALENVEWVDPSHLTATVPTSAPAGFYEVVVSTARGDAVFEETIRIDAPEGE